MTAYKSKIADVAVGFCRTYWINSAWNKIFYLPNVADNFNTYAYGPVKVLPKTNSFRVKL